MSMNNFSAMREQIEAFEAHAAKVKEEISAAENEYYGSFMSNIDMDKSVFDVDSFKDFVKKPYLVIPSGDERYEVLVPSFMDFQVGRLDRQVDAYNVFVVDKYTKWMTGIPDFLSDEIDMDDSQPFKIIDGWLEFDGDYAAVGDFDEYLSQKVINKKDGSGKAKIRKGREFALIAEMINQGELPYIPRSVDESDLRDAQVNFSFRDHQSKGYDHFLAHGTACYVWMTGAGKSFPAMYALDSLRYDENSFRKAVVCYSRAHVDQWKHYFELYAPRLLDEVDLVTYHGLHKLQERNCTYGLIVFDECDYLPAPTFAKAATMDMKYRIGLSASPYREDGNEHFIYALTGAPIGLDWKKTARAMGKEFHEIKVHISDTRQGKVSRIKKLLKEDILPADKRTMIFCDSLDFGDYLSSELGLPYVSGRDSNQLEIIHDNRQVIVSRIGDRGISIDDLEVVLEADFMFGSRRQEVQRTGRLLHGQGERHDIFFTKREFSKYKKRLYELVGHGFKIDFQDGKTELSVPESKPVSLPKKKVEQSAAVPTIGSNVVSVLKTPVVKDEINRRADKSQSSRESVWKALICIARSKKPLTLRDVASIIGVGESTVVRCTRPFRNEKPVLLEDHGGTYSFREDVVQEIIASKAERDEVDSLLSEVLGDE